MNYYKHHLGDYAKDTPHLTIVEHGAYRVLMDACYIAEKPLPLDMERLYAIVRATRPAEKKVIDSVLAEFFIKDETGYHHKRIDEELEKYREKASQNKANGNRGGRPKITQSVINQEPKNNLSHKPVTNNHKPIKTYDAEGFALFWESYPKKVAKPKAEAAWKKQAVSIAERPSILSAIEALKLSESWQKNGGEFIPYPASWINARRWEDGASNEKIRVDA